MTTLTRNQKRGVKAGRKARVSAEARIDFDATEVPAKVQAEPAQPAEETVTNGDSLQLYLREIGQVKLLTPAEEIVLAKRIKKGDEAAREHMIKARSEERRVGR